MFVLGDPRTGRSSSRWRLGVCGPTQAGGMDLPGISPGRLIASILEVRPEVFARLIRGRCHTRSEHPGFTAG